MERNRSERTRCISGASLSSSRKNPVGRPRSLPRSPEGSNAAPEVEARSPLVATLLLLVSLIVALSFQAGFRRTPPLSSFSSRSRYPTGTILDQITSSIMLVGDYIQSCTTEEVIVHINFKQRRLKIKVLKQTESRLSAPVPPVRQNSFPSQPHPVAPSDQNRRASFDVTAAYTGYLPNSNPRKQVGSRQLPVIIQLKSHGDHNSKQIYLCNRRGAERAPKYCSMHGTIS